MFMNYYMLKIQTELFIVFYQEYVCPLKYHEIMYEKLYLYINALKYVKFPVAFLKFVYLYNSKYLNYIRIVKHSHLTLSFINE